MKYKWKMDAMMGEPVGTHAVARPPDPSVRSSVRPTVRPLRASDMPELRESGMNAGIRAIHEHYMWADFLLCVCLQRLYVFITQMRMELSRCAAEVTSAYNVDQYKLYQAGSGEGILNVRPFRAFGNKTARAPNDRRELLSDSSHSH